MKKTLLLTICCILSIAASAQTKYVGGDISVLQSYEDNNVSYYDNTGNKIDDVMKYLKSESVGWNALRVRLFVNPNKTAPNKETGKVDGTTDAQVCQDINYVVRLGKRIKQEGFTATHGQTPLTSGLRKHGYRSTIPSSSKKHMTILQNVYRY